MTVLQNQNILVDPYNQPFSYAYVCTYTICIYVQLQMCVVLYSKKNDTITHRSAFLQSVPTRQYLIFEFSWQTEKKTSYNFQTYSVLVAAKKILEEVLYQKPKYAPYFQELKAQKDNPFFQAISYVNSWCGSLPTTPEFDVRK